MARLPMDERPLDNVVWHSLRGPLSSFAAPTSRPEVVRFDSEVNVFAAVDSFDPAAWTRIAEVIGPRGFCAFTRNAIGELPSGWETHYRGTLLQMIAGDLPTAKGLDLCPLGPADVNDMMALTQLTEAAPFFPRTIELGRYVGVRRDGRLLAMAGERFRVPGFVEMSAVSTHPDARGAGLATELTLDVVRSIRASGNEAFLHVVETNENAARLYQKLGFRIRRKVEVAFVRWHGEHWQDGAASATAKANHGTKP